MDYVWTGAQMRVQIASSSDGGTTWTAPRPIAAKKFTHDQFFPWVKVGGRGLIGVTWLDWRKDPANVNYDAYGAVPADGITFRNQRLSKISSNPSNDGFGGAFMGDYRTSSWGGGTLYATWPDTRGDQATRSKPHAMGCLRSSHRYREWFTLTSLPIQPFTWGETRARDTPK